MVRLTRDQSKLAASLMPIAEAATAKLIPMFRGNPTVRDSIFSAAMDGIMKAAASRRHVANMKSFAWTCCYRMGLKAIRSEMRRMRNIPAIAILRDVDPCSGGDAFAEIDDRDEVETILGQFPEPIATTLRCVYLDGMDQPEAAAKLGCTQQGISHRITRARILARQA